MAVATLLADEVDDESKLAASHDSLVEGDRGAAQGVELSSSRSSCDM